MANIVDPHGNPITNNSELPARKQKISWKALLLLLVVLGLITGSLTFRRITHVDIWAYWELVIASVVIILVIIYDIIVRLTGKEPSAQTHLYGIMAALIAIILTLAHLQQPLDIQHLEDRLVTEHAQGNGYIEDMIRRPLENLASGLHNREWERSPDETQVEAKIAIDKTIKGNNIFAIDTGSPLDLWFDNPSTSNSKPSGYQIANQDAAARGVSISRLFIIPPSLTNQERQLLETLMQEQVKARIDVHCIEKNRLDPNDLLNVDALYVNYGTSLIVLMQEKPRGQGGELRRRATISWGPPGEVKMSDWKKHFDDLVRNARPVTRNGMPCQYDSVANQAGPSVMPGRLTRHKGI
jgi:hypothetical protein